MVRAAFCVEAILDFKKQGVYNIGAIKSKGIKTMSSFENLRVVNNFCQTSLYFPMPTVIISTLCEDGMTNLGPCSLVFKGCVSWAKESGVELITAEHMQIINDKISRKKKKKQLKCLYWFAKIRQ